MKKLFTTVLFASATVIGFAQAPPPPSPCVPNLPGPGGKIVPDTLVNLPHATENAAYNTVVQFFVPQDTTVAGIPFPLTFADYTLDSVQGLPSDFMYLANPVSGVFPANAASCLTLYSDLVTSTPNTYPLIMFVTAHVSAPIETSQVVLIKGYDIVVDQAVGIINRQVNTFGVLGNYPNPAADATTIEFGSDSRTEVSINVYNSIGVLVYSSKVNATSGSNFTKVNTSSFANGNYIYTLNNGTKVINGKFSVAK